MENLSFFLKVLRFMKTISPYNSAEKGNQNVNKIANENDDFQTSPRQVDENFVLISKSRFSLLVLEYYIKSVERLGVPPLANTDRDNTTNYCYH